MTHKLKRIIEVPALRIATIVILVLSLIGLGWALSNRSDYHDGYGYNMMNQSRNFAPHYLQVPTPTVTVTKTITKKVPSPVKTIYVSRSQTRKPISLLSAEYTSPSGVASCIRKWESGGNYSAQNPSSTASGAYQFLDSTWRNVTGLSGRAMNYSPAIQDKAFYKLWNNGAGASQWTTSYHCT